MQRYRLIALGYVLSLIITPATALGQDSGGTITVQVETVAVSQSDTACSGQFVPHELDHTTTATGPKVRMFEANGSGVAINDLDGDGRLDIVLANQAGQNTILWNEGNLSFRTERMMQGDSRAAAIVDVDGDGWLDLVFSGTRNPPVYWRQTQARQFTREFLSGVGKPVYAINWADLNDDGFLDLVGATYGASLLTDYGQEFIASTNAGVFYYPNLDGRFQLNVISTVAQALAVMLIDLNGDGRFDIWVGNDFGVPDQIWYRTDTGWQEAQPLNVMSYSTMSLDFGDIDNDGVNEVISTDMKPYPGEVHGETFLEPVLDAINEGRDLEADPQITANVLLSIDDFADRASTSGVDATGWSWSGKFGDLDQDGFLDLYVVNGFIEVGTFPTLPNNELVEDNQAFQNTGDGRFVRVPQWGLGSARSGRGMSMGDLDNDGDLDIVVNNLTTPAQLFENQLCEGHSLQVDLRWPTSANTHAIGARLSLHTDQAMYYREVKAVSGYLSGDPSRIHFGFPDGAQLERLEIQWPDGVVSSVQPLAADSILTITRRE
jgi:hypothetical protein